MDDRRWLELACDLAGRCPPSRTAFSVGAVVVGPDGREISRGFSRENDPHDHAEESALAKIARGDGAALPGNGLPGDDPYGGDLSGATIYSSLEPCGERKSRPLTCTDLILAAGLRRVVFAWREPSLFVPGTGAELLRDHGVEVVEMPALAERARRPNAHLLGP
ncbi:dCMP deaminase [Actinomadura viridis]|uniref:dCMP deaminase n=1 Tax=Actinomadura viridis TaxID=58110 RepID=UPI0036910547